MSRFSIAFVSDIHVRASTSLVPERFTQVVRNLAGYGLRFVVMGGDATSGNPDDGIDEARVTSWWQSFGEALQPLRAAGVPILPIAGNHDFYTDPHKKGYIAAWQRFPEDVAAQIPLTGQPPFSYSFTIDGVYFLFLHVVDQELVPEVEAYLRAELASAAAKSSSVRLCFGHVPLVSMMGKTNTSFCEQLGGILAAGDVAAYFSGHEHLFWEQYLPFGDRFVRQVHVGTASGAYHFPLSQTVYSTYCQGDRGALPDGRPFDLIPGTRQQKDEVCIVVINLHPGEGAGYDVQHLTLRDGVLVPVFS